MLRPLFVSLLALLPWTWLLAAPPVAYPLTYSGRVGREIYATLTLLGPNAYTYDEGTHAGYSVHDSGRYEVRGPRLVLSSLHTVHRTTGNWHRINGHRVALPDAYSYQRLFRRTVAQLNADTVVVRERRVRYNQAFGLVMVMDR